MSSKATSSSKKEEVHFASCNYQAVLEPNDFDVEVRIMIAVLRHSYLRNPLTRTTSSFPESYIVHAFKSASIDKDENVIRFKLINGTDAVLSRKIFVKSLGYTEVYGKDDEEKETDELLTEYDPNPTDQQVIDFLKHIGYSDQVPVLRDLKKAKFPKSWHLAVHLIIRCLSGKIGGTDAIVKDLVYLLWGIYYNKPVDVGTILWNDFKSFINSSRNDIPHARFWALCLKRIYADAKLSINEELKKFVAPQIAKYRVNPKSPAEIRRLPAHLLNAVGSAHPLVVQYLLDTAELLSAQQNPFPDAEAAPAAEEEEQQKEPSAETTKKAPKRKGVQFSSPPQKKKPHLYNIPLQHDFGKPLLFLTLYNHNTRTLHFSMVMIRKVNLPEQKGDLLSTLSESKIFCKT